MEKDILEEICKNCVWYERIVIKVFKELVIKVYHVARINTMNNIL